MRSLHALHTCHTRTVSTVYTRSSCAAYLQILQSTGPTGDGACLAKGKQYSLLLSFWPKCEKAEMSRRIRPKGVLIYYIIILLLLLFSLSLSLLLYYILLYYIILYYTSGGTKFMLLESFTKHPFRSPADHIFKSVLRGRCGTVNYHPLLNI